MIYLSPIEKNRRRTVRLRTLAIVLLGFVFFTLFDLPLLHIFYLGEDRWVEHHDWYRFLRILGFLGTWAAIGFVFVLYDRNRHRGAAVFLSALTSGALAELGKRIIGRERPVEDGVLQGGYYHFRPLFSGFSDGSNLGIPSSHAAVAFGGCLMLAALIPNTRRFLILLAIGCGMTRMLTGAHFSSDVYLGAIIGWLVSRLFVRLTPSHLIS
ncbi:MAG: phosphatase PAP2 family protein [Phycisphaerales bacterium]|nr:phosphatase PAP2 family protein [Phycisphaerales bacterium]